MRWLIAALMLVGSGLAAQDFSGLARVDMAQSQIVDDQDGLAIDLSLSQPVPYRVFTLDAPPRLVVDFREVDWNGVTRAALLNADRAVDVRFGALRPGWSRMVVDLAGPLVIEVAGLAVDPASGRADLNMRLLPTSAEAFAALSGTPSEGGWGDPGAPESSLLPVPPKDDVITVVIDPGHGGIDPGATRGDIQEADLMLALAIETAEALRRTGLVRAILTRESDVFVSLDARITMARQSGASLMISLHADALEADQASGASVYTLSQEGTDSASQRMAERHERGDILAGLDLSAQDDRVATVLMDLARAETAPQGLRFADTLVQTLQGTGARLNSRPRRFGRLAVLNAADFASVLVEVGFLSSDRDRAQLSTPEGRAPIVTAIVDAVVLWAADEAARAPLVRQ